MFFPRPPFFRPDIGAQHRRIRRDGAGPASRLDEGMIAFFGTGLLGAGFVRALLRRGETVHVWNRTEHKARALETEGARVFSSPELAVKGAERIHLSLSDDSAVDEVLERAGPGLEPGAFIV